MVLKNFTFIVDDPDISEARPGSPHPFFYLISGTPSPDLRYNCIGRSAEGDAREAAARRRLRALAPRPPPLRAQPSRTLLGRAVVEPPVSAFHERMQTPIPKTDYALWAKSTTDNSIMLAARDLSIAWGDNPSYWEWKDAAEVEPDEAARSQDEQRVHEQIEVAELRIVCWLDIRGKYKISELMLETTYDVSFVIMLIDTSDWSRAPMNFMLALPDGTKLESEKSFEDLPRGVWLEIPAGELRTTSQPLPKGEMEFSMRNVDDYCWKSGLVVKGVRIRPKP